MTSAARSGLPAEIMTGASPILKRPSGSIPTTRPQRSRTGPRFTLPRPTWSMANSRSARCSRTALPWSSMGTRPACFIHGPRKFAGEDLGQRIRWDSAAPAPEADAEHHPPTANSPGRIRVRGKHKDGPDTGHQRTAEEMWSEAVFELYNILGVKDFHRLEGDVAAGKLSKEEFFARMFEVECCAEQKTRAFYIRVFLPWAKEHRLPTNLCASGSLPGHGIPCFRGGRRTGPTAGITNGSMTGSSWTP